MKEVRLGGIYIHKRRQVEITAEKTGYKGRVSWEAKNLATGRTVHVKSARGLTPIRSHLIEGELINLPQKAGNKSKEDNTMAKEKTEKQWLEEYESVEDTAKRSKMRREMRKVGVFLSKINGNGENNPKPKKEIPKPEAPKTAAGPGTVKVKITVGSGPETTHYVTLDKDNAITIEIG